jgi:putative restriction endonuclease
MKEGQKLWTKDELILAINLYYKIPFGRMHSSNPEVKKLATLIGRTPGSVAYKLVNFASLDPSLQAWGIKGASNASNLDKATWLEFYTNLENLAFESEKLLATTEHTTVEQLNNIPEKELLQEGRTREALVKLRVNQSFFRKSVLAAYNNTCCITGLQIPSLLISGHIVPWSVDEKNRLNPRNGIAINALHDKAFENGLMTITLDYKIKISSFLKDQKNNDVCGDYFCKYDGKDILLPSKFLPDPEFLKIHNSNFKG